MRDILFRGKAINRNKGYHRTKYKNGDWVYGLLTRLYDAQFENLPAEMTNTDGVSGIEIDHKTIGQYTGLTDKNGKKIFEGDIVKWNINFAIVWQDCKFVIKKDINAKPYDYVLSCFDGTEFEVIGNIHDNPELLKGGEG